LLACSDILVSPFLLKEEFPSKVAFTGFQNPPVHGGYEVQRTPDGRVLDSEAAGSLALPQNPTYELSTHAITGCTVVNQNPDLASSVINLSYTMVHILMTYLAAIPSSGETLSGAIKGVFSTEQGGLAWLTEHNIMYLCI
jgi:hypothetical protein